MNLSHFGLFFPLKFLRNVKHIRDINIQYQFSVPNYNLLKSENAEVYYNGLSSKWKYSMEKKFQLQL